LEKGEIEMEYDQMFRQMMAFNKTTFDNGFNALVTLQEQNEKMANTFLEQAPWLPGELRNVIDVWLSTCKNGRGDFKRLVDDNFNKVEAFFGAPKVKPAKTAKAK
jgi:hypothetical protein